jgi:hypothetical protein
MPSEDDLSSVARGLLTVFRPWLGENYPELEIGTETELTG